MTIWQILEIEATHDKKSIKKAYAKMIKKYHPEEYLREYQRVRSAYEKALEFAAVIAQAQKEDSFTTMVRRNKKEQDRRFMEHMGIEYPHVVSSNPAADKQSNDVRNEQAPLDFSILNQEMENPSEERAVDFSQLDNEGEFSAEEDIFSSVSSFQEKYNRYQELYIQPQLESRKQSDFSEINHLDFWKTYLESADAEAKLLYIGQVISQVDNLEVLYYLYYYTYSVDFYHIHKKKTLKAIRYQFELLYLSQEDTASLKKWNILYSVIFPFYYLGIYFTFFGLLSKLSQAFVGPTLYVSLLLFLDMLVSARHFRNRMKSLVVDVKRYRYVQSGLLYLIPFLLVLKMLSDSPNLLIRLQNFESFLLWIYALILLFRVLSVLPYDIVHKVYRGRSMPIVKSLGFLAYSVSTIYLLRLYYENLSLFTLMIALLPILSGIQFNRKKVRHLEENFSPAITSIPFLAGLKKYIKESGGNWYRFVEIIANFLTLSSLVLGIAYIDGRTSLVINIWVFASFVFLVFFFLLKEFIRSYIRKH